MKPQKVLKTVGLVLTLLMFNSCGDLVPAEEDEEEGGASGQLAGDSDDNDHVAKLVFSAEFAPIVGECNSVKVASSDETDTEALMDADAEVTLSATFGEFYSDSECITAVTTATIPAGSSSVNIYYSHDSMEDEVKLTADGPEGSGWEQALYNGPVHSTILGIWYSDCLVEIDPGDSDPEPLNVKVYTQKFSFYPSGSFSYEEYEYVDSTDGTNVNSDCSGQAVVNSSAMGTYSVGDDVSGMDHVKELDFTISAFYFFTSLQEVADQWNAELDNCTYEPNLPVDWIASPDCALSPTFPTAAWTEYTIFTTEDGIFYTGDESNTASGHSVEDRHDTLGSVGATQR